MGILNKHTEHMQKCPTCGGMYDVRFQDKVVEHMHTGFKLDETIKGVKVGGQECTGCEFENLEDAVCKCKTCGKIIDLAKL